MWKWLLLAFAFSTPVLADNCFSQADLANVTPSGLRIVQPTQVPLSDSSASLYYPASHFTATNLSNAQTSTFSTAYQDAVVWVNRGDDGTVHKPNPPNGPRVMVTIGSVTAPCFAKYSTKAIADAATWSNIAYTIGRSTTHSGRGWLDYTRAAGIADTNVLEWAAFVADASTICTGTYTDSTGTFFYSTDYVIEPSAKLSTVPTTPTQTVFLDYEPHDSRTTTETNALVYEACQNIHGRGYLCGGYNNPLNGSQAPQNGIDGTNVDYLAARYDQMGIYPFPKSGDTYLGSFNEQLAMFTSPPCAKFNLQADMAMGNSDASALRAAATAAACPFGGVWFFYDAQTPGGVCTTDYNVKEDIFLGLTK